MPFDIVGRISSNSNKNQPSYDGWESNDEIVINIEIPGISKEDFNNSVKVYTIVDENNNLMLILNANKLSKYQKANK